MQKKSQQSPGNHKYRLYQQARSPYWFVRLTGDGKRRAFSTRETVKKRAENKAKVIMADIQSRGFDEAVKIHCAVNTPKERTATELLNPDCSSIGPLYKELCKKWDTAPSSITVARYIRNFESIYTHAKAKHISDLTEASIEDFRTKYLRKAKRAGREDRSSKLSVNSIIRNSAALFSTKALREYKRQGYTITNPFVDIEAQRILKSSYTPLDRSVVDLLWQNAHLLRDGDPEAPEPDKKIPARRRYDFREANPEAYLLLLLELGLGLRRNEADKVQWDWFYERDKRHFIEVRLTRYFKPKSGQSRIIPVAEDLWKLLQFNRKDKAVFVVPGKKPKTLKQREELSTISYRCDRDHRHLSAWLRSMGVDDQKPCHRLRKEFGSYIATQFGLYHAQRMLGHSSPTVTADHYAGLTDLPDINPTGMGSTK